MTSALVRKTWRDDRRAVLGWAVGVAAFTTMYTSFYSQFQGAAELKQDALPQGMLDFLGIADMLSPEDFSEPLMGRIFAAIVREHSLGKAANSVTLRAYFGDDPDMAECGGPGFLATLTGSGVAMIGARDFARQIADLASRRRLIDGLNRTANLKDSCPAVIIGRKLAHIFAGGDAPKGFADRGELARLGPAGDRLGVDAEHRRHLCRGQQGLCLWCTC